MIHYISEKLGAHAILKGGMVLRLLECPRYTNDLDYVFIPFASKKEIAPLLERVLKELPGVSIQHRVHSTNAQFDVVLKNDFGVFKTQIEANVAKSCETYPLSTGDVALSFQQAPHIVRVMRLDVLLAHKLAAWNERRLMRDLYDIYFVHKNLNELPNKEILRERLADIHYAKRTKGRSWPKSMSPADFWTLFEKEVKKTDPKTLEEELRDFLTPEQLAGLDKKMQGVLLQMTEKVR
ncbi:MAG: hypothetical protein A3F82_01095 [Deltaproteobacteria bacterium RIFCSPLOWO2_12_FULL_44_12]|nr:MAG: hypothetical protein A2712_03860 [Deltaproteobacteria bacterium RIFCSPHIGHO2_01_FULL_43_49]OGQ16322.1 MAG: hypothetical protein A3D22_01830 [Deltaproteobacteria bacterium RIFCSPHIGHO2_02_FULL_44_53]OGQ29282.1 MAG: hypothetical protein A3D98_05615 [Deltaproteobacteria bacterium RIFCSPHIGHO2_12_FULL_44_21]OGQ32839.1 MAG: hypothetical protein A2979_09760 [Deltaproteobacteria bacterium RIFCSPLOWO2_01_FULL_45_74]OGQ41940.1 MAG: hypothetical protein A3I70_09545 [Deltaproteobacteria bacterium 